MSRTPAPNTGPSRPSPAVVAAVRAGAGARPGKVRLDQLVVDRGLAETRTRAQALLMAGAVRVGEGDGARADRKPGDMVDPATPLAATAALPYVSRGGDKLAGALDAFGVDPAGQVCVDAGASTGGFTDCLLQRGAARVHAVDVGRGQLAATLVRDPRVVVHDRVNARNLAPEVLAEGEPITLAVIDVSFIGLGLVLGPVASCLAPGAEVVALVKPQFEAGRRDAPGGVVRDANVHRAVLHRAVEAARAAGLTPLDLCRSPLTGPAGNTEFFLRATRGPAPADPGAFDAETRISEVTA